MKSVKIALLAFASAGDILGTGETTLELAPRTTLAQLKTLLEERHPPLRGLWSRLAIAVNGDLRSDDTALADGDEVALLPPVSGGSGAAERDGASELTALTDDPLDADAVVRRVADPSCGAVVVFSGTVRDSHRGRPVDRITYSAYRAMAQARLREIASRLERRYQGTRVAIVHRLGELRGGGAQRRDRGRFAASRGGLRRQSRSARAAQDRSADLEARALRRRRVALARGGAASGARRERSAAGPTPAPSARHAT